MATQTNQVAQKKSTLPEALEQHLKALMPQIPVLLPPDITTEQFRAALWLELSGRPSLLQCTADSLRECAIKSATYGLLPGRDCHFLPFNNREGGGGKRATYVPNYHGIILALERSGKVRRAFAHAVHEGDEWGFDMFADRPVHKPAVTLGKKPGKELFYYGAVMFVDGTCAFEVVTLDDLEAIRRRSPAHDSGPWSTDTVMMKRKSALKRVAKYVRLTPTLRSMLEDDEGRERDDIPEERHRQNIVDLFGDTAGGSEMPRDTPKNTREGGKGSADKPSPVLPTDDHRESLATLEAHKDNAELPDDLLDRVNAALSPLAPATEEEAFALASEVVGYLDNLKEAGA